jgi:UDP-GlcNAc:undecaprenyl-phosphate/decaprenyl-phosphate GlcNAc-1-phosphate transferase
VPDATGFALVVAQTFLVAAAATWLIRALARRRGWLAPTRPDRWHREPTALYGGVGIFAGFASGLLWHVPWSPFMGALLALTAIMFVTGIVDDATEIRPQTKVVLQLTGGLLLYAAGFSFNDAFVWWVDMAVVVFWVVAITNAMNLLDNMNGLAAGIAVIAGLSRLLLSYQIGNAEGALASAVFVGAVLGFLIFNFPRASIFMGDGGSFTIGFALAALNLSSGQAYSKSTFSIFIFPVLALAIPIFDTAFVSVVRYFSGRAISQGGRDHTSHRLVAIGLSETTAVVTLWGISAAAGGIAYLLYNVGASYALFAMAILLLGLALFGIVLARVRVYPEGAAPDGPAAAWGFTLPGELLYKRQILWVLVDAVTVVLAVSAALAWAPAPTTAAAVVMAAAPGADVLATVQAAALPVSVAAMVVGLFAVGLYQWDWVEFGPGVAARVVAGGALGTVMVAGIQWSGGLATTWTLGGLALAWATVVVSVCGTRVFVRIIDAWLHRAGGLRG